MLFQSFADPAEEREYCITERVARAPIIRRLAWIASLVLFLYLLVNPLFIDRSLVADFTIATIPLMASLAVYAYVTGLDAYPPRPWLDYVFFVVFGLGLAILGTIIARQAAYTRWEPHTILAINSLILLAFSCFTFAASGKWFSWWCVTLSIGFFALLAAIEIAPIAKIYATINFVTVLFLVVCANWYLDQRSRTVFDLRKKLDEEKGNVEGLLHNVLPKAVADRLRAGETVADAFMDASVIFIDVVGFSTMAKMLSPGHLVHLLNLFFSAVDEIAEECGVEKVKTIGDAYLAVVGGTMSSPNSGVTAVAFARQVIDRVRDIEKEAGLQFKVRIGIHTGPVIGGVIGSKKMAYDYWGDTMNVASRIQGAADPGGLCVSAATYFRTKNIQVYRPARKIALKGIGETEVFDADFPIALADYGAAQKQA